MVIYCWVITIVFLLMLTSLHKTTRIIDEYLVKEGGKPPVNPYLSTLAALITMLLMAVWTNKDLKVSHDNYKKGGKSE